MIPQAMIITATGRVVMEGWCDFANPGTGYDPAVHTIVSSAGHSVPDLWNEETDEEQAVYWDGAAFTLTAP